MKFKPGDGNDVLFAALEKQAQTISAPQGYAVCNDTGEPLLAAIAQTGRQAQLTRLVADRAQGLRPHADHAPDRPGLSSGAEAGRRGAGGRQRKILHHRRGL